MTIPDHYLTLSGNWLLVAEVCRVDVTSFLTAFSKVLVLSRTTYPQRPNIPTSTAW